ncbi:AEC family transporter [Zymomonas mobilis]|uniref:Auxin Efflux Carrier n=1 Tax=Zymomonas mobilis subsp. pomaceae (strain ATCC 29192 / DSM 22645 / JCM 10191 / CCUG 17912 / NBRC 13757 / NCIMB 11200 / NRRL B-4491 / Barker I) TaxID=579138 RepID=F8EVP4_ZYMMT|nr:AEC family transporter [Zymomonas mobilis]AEI38381.1 Auxin Efflux Carrier [Zymomonas mobilis subsp. pomaceae ATCC 29192]MDX5948071.1 AEC family transporter [Zymomonas mobilis subsp. pomaceae]GEB89400.1 auxin efflux carrier [Zymomonas mobilis subsp. pomaceae]
MLDQMLVLAAIITLGAICHRISWISHKGAAELSRLVVNVFNPALILSGAGYAAKETNLDGIILNFVIASLVFIGLIFVAYLYNNISRTLKDQRPLYALLTVFPNVGFMGIPVAQSIFGPSIVIDVSIYILVYNILIYTYGVYIVQSASDQTVTHLNLATLKKLLNPGFMACLALILVLATGIKLPKFINNMTLEMGRCAVVLAMFLIGVSIAQHRLLDIITNRRILTFSLLKMIVLPLLLLGIFRIIGWNDRVSKLIILMIAMPVGNITALLALEYGADDTICSRAIVLTTAISLGTLVLISHFLG